MRRRPLTPQAQRLVARFAGEHEALRPILARLRATADLVAADPTAADRVAALRDVHTQLVERLLPHEDEEEHRLLPALARPLGDEATDPASRSHVEIHRLVDRLGGHLDRTLDGRLDRDLVPDLLATLYGLDAVLRLHFAQEEESMFSLASVDPDPGAGPR
ncbi:MAG TPA: hemerythrin domain-containing protein [Micromonosporaceae bacterium]